MKKLHRPYKRRRTVQSRAVHSSYSLAEKT
nr:MAG TPA: hypothetical protein [Caudoviricetes sp.]